MPLSPVNPGVKIREMFISQRIIRKDDPTVVS